VSKPVAVNPQEKLYTVDEVAVMLRCERHYVTSLFAHEPDVFVFGNRETTATHRKYRKFRIPQSTLNRVASRFRNRTGVQQ